MTLLLTGVLISIGTLVSVVNVANLSPEEDRTEKLKSQLKELKSKTSRSEVQSQIADIEWQLNDLSAAEKIWYSKWLEMTTNWKTADYKDFGKVAQNLASVYMDHGNFDQALKIYEVLLDYDKRLHGEMSQQVAKDLNNQAMCLYLRGSTLAVGSKRNEYFEKSLKQIHASNAIWSARKIKLSDFNTKQNENLKALIERDKSG